MNRYATTLLALIASTATLPPVVHAEANAMVSSVDTSSVYYTHTPGQRYRITTYTGQLTTLVFPENEVIIVDPAVGVGEIWENSRLAPNIIAVRPLNPIGRSNMAVVTEDVQSKQRRMYMLDLIIKQSPKTLVAGGALPPDMMWTVYFGESKTAKWGWQQPVAEVRPKQVVSSAAVTPKVAVFPTAHTVPKKARNMRYGYRGESKLVPVEVFDNGIFTFLTFSPNNELPILTRVDMVGTEQLVNYRPDARNRNTLIVEGVYPVLVARYEKLSACLVNMQLVPHSKLAVSTVKKTK